MFKAVKQSKFKKYFKVHVKKVFKSLLTNS